jgi:putative MATE family efflux protein
VRRIAIPAAVGFMFNTLYNVVDTWYGGRVSTDALAAMSLSFPVFFTIIAIGTGISTGSTALVANALGAGDLKKARFFSMQAISFTAFAGCILTAIGLMSAPALFRILGASGAYLDLALQYTNVIFYGTLLFMLTFTLSSILNAEGDTKTYRNLLVLGFFLNLLLDPWFIYGGFGVPAMGVSGVAWATVVIQLIVAILLAVKLARNNIFCRECLGMLKPRLLYFIDIAKQGFPASLNMMSVAIGVFIITLYISKYGQQAVAAFGIATRFDQVANLPVIGLNIAALALVGQNNGARLPDRVRETVRTVLRYAYGVIAVGMLGVIFFSASLIGFFSDDGEVIRIGSQYLKISALVYFAYASLYISVSVLQGLKKPNMAVWIGAYRQIAAPLAVFWIMERVFGLGLTGIWWGIFAANWSAAVFVLWYLRRELKKLGSY